MRIFVPRPLKGKNRYKPSWRSRQSMIKSLKKRGFTDKLLETKTHKELDQMMNRFASSKNTPSTDTFGKLTPPKNWIYL